MIWRALFRAKLSSLAILTLASRANAKDCPQWEVDTETPKFIITEDLEQSNADINWREFFDIDDKIEASSFYFDHRSDCTVYIPFESAIKTQPNKGPYGNQQFRTPEWIGENSGVR